MRESATERKRREAGRATKTLSEVVVEEDDEGRLGEEV
jgi:hypothetical protein